MSDENIILSQVTASEITVSTARKRIDEHWCDHPGCKRWGCFGYAGRY
jgi:hypothetical protein